MRRGRSRTRGTTSTASRASRTSCSRASTRSIRTRRSRRSPPVSGPRRFCSLDPRAWSALVGGLALRRDQRTASVAAFLADLGVTGRERLRRASEADRGRHGEHRRAATPARDDDADWGDLSDKTLETVSVEAARPEGGERDARRHERAGRRSPGTSCSGHAATQERPRSASRWLPWVLAIGGAAAAVYWNYAWLQQRGPEWFAMGRDADRESGRQSGRGVAGERRRPMQRLPRRVRRSRTRRPQAPERGERTAARRAAARRVALRLRRKTGPPRKTERGTERFDHAGKRSEPRAEGRERSAPATDPTLRRQLTAR